MSSSEEACCAARMVALERRGEELCARVCALEASVALAAAALRDTQAHLGRVDDSLQKALESMFPRVEELLRGLQAKAGTSTHARPLLTTRATAPPAEAVDAASRTWREVNGERERQRSERQRSERPPRRTHPRLARSEPAPATPTAHAVAAEEQTNCSKGAVTAPSNGRGAGQRGTANGLSSATGSSGEVGDGGGGGGGGRRGSKRGFGRQLTMDHGDDDSVIDELSRCSLSADNRSASDGEDPGADRRDSRGGSRGSLSSRGSKQFGRQLSLDYGDEGVTDEQVAREIPSEMGESHAEPSPLPFTRQRGTKNEKGKMDGYDEEDGDSDDESSFTSPTSRLADEITVDREEIASDATVESCEDNPVLAESVGPFMSAIVSSTGLPAAGGSASGSGSCGGGAMKRAARWVSRVLGGVASAAAVEAATAAEATLSAAAAAGDTRALRKLLAAADKRATAAHPSAQEKGAKWLARSRDAAGDTALHCAARNGHVAAAKALLRAGAKVGACGHLLQTPLHCAAANGHTTMVIMLLEAGSPVDAQDINGDTALGLASAVGAEDCVDLLLDARALVDVHNLSGRSALLLAVTAGHVTVVRMLLYEGANVATPADGEGESPLVAAVSLGYVDIVEALLESGASPDTADSHGQTVIQIASAAGYTNVVKLLLEYGASARALEAPGLTAIALAAKIGHTDVVKLLLESHIPEIFSLSIFRRWGFLTTVRCLIHALATQKSRALHYIVMRLRGVIVDCTFTTYRALILAAEQGHADVVKLLLDADAGLKDCIRPALCAAAKHGHVAVVEMLVRCQRDAEAIKDALCVAKDATTVWALVDGSPGTLRGASSGADALFCAVNDKRTGTLKALLGTGLDPDARSTEGETTLHVAALKGNVELVDFLVQNGAEVSAKDNIGYTALHRAASSGEEECVSKLVSLGASLSAATNEGVTPLHIAALEGHIGCVKTLLELGADANGADHNGWTALFYAARHCHNDCVVLLLERGAHIDAQDSTGRTALHYAADKGQAPCISLLLERGTNLRLKDLTGHTPLHLAARAGRTASVLTLLQCGADMNVKDIKGQTPLYLACKYGRVECVSLLVQRGADVVSADNEGRTPLHAAALELEEGCGDVVQILLSTGVSHAVLDNSGHTPRDYAASETVRNMLDNVIAI